MRKIEQKYMTEVQGENSEKFNYYTECVSDKNIIIENKELKRFVARSSRAPLCTVQNLYYGTSDLQLHVLKWQKMMSNLQLRVV